MVEMTEALADIELSFEELTGNQVNTNYSHQLYTSQIYTAIHKQLLRHKCSYNMEC